MLEEGFEGRACEELGQEVGEDVAHAVEMVVAKDVLLHVLTNFEVANIKVARAR